MKPQLCLFLKKPSLVIVAVCQPQLWSTHVRLCVCVCLCVCVHDNSQSNGSIYLNFEHIVVYGNSSDEFDIRHCAIKVKVTAVFLHLPHTNCQVLYLSLDTC